MTEARLEQLEAQQSAPQAPAAGGISESTIEQLKKLGDLKGAGILTADEFEEQKRKLLNAT